MKNLFNVPMVRMFGIAALVAVIGFSMVSCDDDPGGDPNPGGGTLEFELLTEYSARIPANVDTYRVRNGTVTSGAVVIPATHEGKAVTEIPPNGFAQTSITSVTIPDSITYIGAYAFYLCDRLTSVTFQGTIELDITTFDTSDLRTKYLEGGPGTYTRTSGTQMALSVWTKQ